MTPLTQIALLAVVILAGTFVAARGLREAYRAVEQYRADVAEADALDAWDEAVTDALRLAATARHPVTQRPSVAGWWRRHFPRGRTHPILRLITEDQ